MYVRVVTGMADPERIDKLIAVFEQQVVPDARNQPGYLGAAFVVDRETGGASGRTRWESLDALNASEQASMEARRQLGAAQIVNVLDVDRYEMVIEERTVEARSPGFMRINELYVRPERIDGLVAFMRERATSVTSQAGCRSLLMWVNRATGRCHVNSVWATAQDRDASEGAVSGLRQEAGELAGAAPRVRLAEVAFVEILQSVKPS